MMGGKYATCRDDLPTLPWRTGLSGFSGGLCAASVFPVFILVLAWFSQTSTGEKNLASGCPP